MSDLPARPSLEYLRKAAKRSGREQGIGLAQAQRDLAKTYGYRSWAQLRQFVVERADGTSQLLAAIRSARVESVRDLLMGGVNPNLGNGVEAPLHVAARRGPRAIVEALLAAGALEWQRDADGRLPLEVARSGRSADRSAIVALLDRSSITDPSFAAAVRAIHRGDAAELGRLIDAQPRLLHDRMLGPDVYRAATRHQYFRDPKLFWFIANNPTTIERMAANIVDVARAMIERGVEPRDLNYALELTMTSRVAREQHHQLPLVGALIAAGAVPTREAVVAAAAYGELQVLEALVVDGYELNAPLAAALSSNVKLRALLRTADALDIQTAFGLAVISRNRDGAELALDSGADINAFLPVHAHSTALHQAAVNDDPVTIELLLARGAMREKRDLLWDGTALDWAIHEHKPAAQAALAEPSKSRSSRGSG